MQNVVRRLQLENVAEQPKMVTQGMVTHQQVRTPLSEGGDMGGVRMRGKGAEETEGSRASAQTGRN